MSLHANKQLPIQAKAAKNAKAAPACNVELHPPPIHASAAIVQAPMKINTAPATDTPKFNVPHFPSSKFTRSLRSLTQSTIQSLKKKEKCKLLNFFDLEKKFFLRIVYLQS